MGIAENLHDAVEMAKVRGSPGYAAPEMVSGKPYDELVHVFSAGCVYYHALTRQQPFLGQTLAPTNLRTNHLLHL